MKSQSVSDDRIPLASTVSAKRVQLISFKGLLAYDIHWAGDRPFSVAQSLLFSPQERASRTMWCAFPSASHLGRLLLSDYEASLGWWSKTFNGSEMARSSECTG